MPLFLIFTQTTASDVNWLYCQKSNQNNGYIVCGEQYVNGNTISKVAYTKVDFSGNIMWQKSITDNNDLIIPYTLNKGQSKYYICGLSYANGFGSPGDAYVLAFDENGNKVWDYLGGENNTDIFYGVCEKNNGEVIVTGYSNSFSTIDDLLLLKLSSTGTLISSKRIYNNTNNTEQGLKVKATSDGGYIVMGVIKTASFNNLLLIKFNANDNISWAKQYSNGSFYDPVDIIESSNGDLIVTGSNNVAGIQANNLLRTDANGNKLWFKTYSTGILERPSEIMEQNGNIYVSGMVQVPGSSSILDAQYFATDNNGNLLFSNKINVNGMDGKRIGCLETDAINQNEISMVVAEFISTPRLFDIGVQKVSIHSNTCDNAEYPLTEGTLNITETNLNLNQQNISLIEFNGFNTQNISEFSSAYCEQDVYPYFEVTTDPCTGTIINNNLSTNGTSYSWDFGNGSTSSFANPSYTYNSSGTYTITLYATDNMGNTDWYDIDVNITLNTNFANAGNNINICQGSSTTLNASGGNNYSWSPSTGLNNTGIANPTATPTSTTTYTVTVTNANGCTDTDQVTVTVNANPNVSFSLPTFTSSSSPISLSGSPAGGTFSGNGIIFNGFNPGLVAEGQHTITYTYTDANGCIGTVQHTILVFTITYNFVNYNLGTIAPKLTNLLESDIHFTGTEDLQLSFFNINGQIIQEQQIKIQEIQTVFLDLIEKLNRGNFVYVLKNDKQIISGKISIIR